jgi:diguanylate cyclase (GGDEF)-like protein
MEVDAGETPVLHITSSFGVATLSQEVNSVDDLYMAADTAMYRAKDGGRNCVVAFAPPAYSS